VPYASRLGASQKRTPAVDIRAKSRARWSVSENRKTRPHLGGRSPQPV